jgi:hypothetical protein
VQLVGQWQLVFLKLCTHDALVEDLFDGGAFFRIFVKQPQTQSGQLTRDELRVGRLNFGAHDFHNESTLVARFEGVVQSAALVEQHTQRPAVTLVSVRLVRTQLW